jgi:alpha-tubulin suppressor-like RCC1 family protein
MSFVLVACAQRDENPPASVPPGGGKADGPSCTTTCDVACSDGACAVAMQVTTGGWHSCARLDDGSVWCWGSDWDGQLGLGLAGLTPHTCGNGTSSTPCRLTPYRVQGLPPVTSVAAGRDYTCAILEDATVRCWGTNFDDVLGIGDRQIGRCDIAGVTEACLKTPDGNPGLNDVVSIAPGDDHTCALTGSGEVWCWGTNGYGQLGYQGAYSNVPIQVPGLSGVTAIATGAHHSCALMSDTTVKCWGQNDHGEVGDGTASFWHYTPTDVVGLTGASQLALGERFSCALLLDGTVQCWGANTLGELGNGSFTSSLVPVPVQGLTDATEVVAGEYRACARTQGEVRCWGLGGDGMGFEPTSSCPSSASYKCAPEPGVVAGLTDVTQLALGNVDSCALGADGQVWCWGDNLVGSVGDGTLQDATEPQLVAW